MGSTGIKARLSHAQWSLKPHADGPVRGSTLLPLYPKLPLAAQADACLHELPKLTDTLRGFTRL